MTWTEGIILINLDYTENKNHNNNCNSHYDGNRVTGEEQESDNLEGLE